MFYSSPLDLDFMMIESFGDAYGIDAMLELQNPDQTTVKAVLGKSHDAFADQYTAGQQQLFDAYHRRFKLGSKPSDVTPVSHPAITRVLADLELGLVGLARGRSAQLNQRYASGRSSSVERICVSLRRQPSQLRVRPGFVVVAPPLSTARACGRDRNSVSFSSSSRRRPLKLSLKPFMLGLPGAM